MSLATLAPLDNRNSVKILALEVPRDFPRFWCPMWHYDTLSSCYYHPRYKRFLHIPTSICAYFLFHVSCWFNPSLMWLLQLIHWGRVTHICVKKLTIIVSDNGLSPGRRQAIIWTNAGILLIRTSGTNFSEILDEIHSFSFSKMRLKLSSAKWHLFGLGFNELKRWIWTWLVIGGYQRIRVWDRFQQCPPKMLP